MKPVLEFGVGAMADMSPQWFLGRNKKSSSVEYQSRQSQIGCIIVSRFYGKYITINYKVYLFLDSAFTERILGLPAENYKGYVEADATQRARLIKSNSFFLIHGLADSTAPYVHGVQLAKSLTEANILFRYQVSYIKCIILYNLYFLYFNYNYILYLCYLQFKISRIGSNRIALFQLFYF